MCIRPIINRRCLQSRGTRTPADFVIHFLLLLKSTEIEENGLMLAAFDFAAYSNAIHRLESGDRLLLYTDGIVEASNASGDALGQDALWSLLRKTVGLSSSEAADSIMSSVRQ
jgi:sigma-B regulation protein RsbU (phosphoserine phosphatase)